MAEMVRKFKRLRCKHCNTKFVVMDTWTNSLLPVELKDGIEYQITEKFESKKHISHLSNCQGRQQDWQKLKHTFKKYPDMRFTMVPVIAVDSLQTIIDEACGEINKKGTPTLTPGSERYEQAKLEFEEQLKGDKK